MAERIPYPVVSGEFVRIYRPAGDVYRGPETNSFQPGTYYDSWIANDFSVINDGGRWHMLGITHPKPPDFIDDYRTGRNGHEAEYMLFHAAAEGRTMADVVREESFRDLPKILYPSERPDEIPECHAPHIRSDGCGGFDIVYGPRFMRLAHTADFEHFDRQTLFTAENTARDPFVFRDDDGLYYLVYAVEDRVDYRTSWDMREFSEAKTLQKNPWHFPNGTGAASESPTLFKRKGYYYLTWTLYDRWCGSYDHRTFVFASRTLDGFEGISPVAMLPAHAGEIYSDESGDWLLSVFYPQNGISAAPIRWENDGDE